MSLIFITSGATRAGEVRAGTADCADARLQKRMNGETRAKKEQIFFILVTDLRTGSEVPQNGGADGPARAKHAPSKMLSGWFGIYTNTETQQDNTQKSQ